MSSLIRLRSIIGAAMFGACFSHVAFADVELGILSCKSMPDSRVNLVIRSTVDIKCRLQYAGGVVERYKGETGIAIGLDLSFKGEEELAFSVIAASHIAPGNHPVTGKYVGGKYLGGKSVGGKASTSTVFGLGGAALVGGSNDSFGLTPLTLVTNRGAGIAGGIGFLYIEPDI